MDSSTIDAERSHAALNWAPRDDKGAVPMKKYALATLLVLAGLVLPAGWHTIFYDNFVTSAPKGQFPGSVYGAKWRA